MRKTKSKPKEPAQAKADADTAAGRWRNRIVGHGSKPADQFTGHPNNPRKHPQSQRDALRGSLDTLGWVAPVIESVNSGFIIDGHERIWQALAADNAEVPYIQVDLTPEEESQALLSLDFIAAMAETDKVNMDELLRSFNSDNADVQTFLAGLAQESHLDFMGINAAAAEMADAEPQIDRAEELNKVWQVKTGDLWQIGSHRLLCGDSTKAEDVSRVMDQDNATLVFTDPPYGVSIGKKNAMLNTFQPSGRCLADLELDDMQPDDLKVMLLNSFKSWKPYFSDDCSVFVCSPQGGGLGMMMMMMMQECGLTVKHIVNWAKNAPTFSMGRLDYDYQHEPILFTWMKTHKSKKEGMFKSSLWHVDKPMKNKEHPTMKPVELPTNAILNHTDVGDIVVDMFGGSGTTMIAAENTNRVSRIIEKSENFCAVILQRMKDAFPNLEISRCDTTG
jgi:DNA modification methylase